MYDNLKFNFKGYDYNLDDHQKAVIYFQLMDLESHLTRYFENEDFGNDSMNFVSVLFENNTQQIPVTLAKWYSLTPEKRAKYCLGNEKVSKILTTALIACKNDIYLSDDEIKDLLENYLYAEYYPYYSGAIENAPKIKKLPAEFISSNRELIKAATCNGIIRNHMVKKQENITRVTSAIENLSSTDESSK